MLNDTTRRIRRELRTLRSRYLLLLAAALCGGACLLLGGAWYHLPVAMLLSGLALPVGLRTRVLYLGVARSLHLLGA